MQNKGKWYLQWWGWIILVFSFIFATFGIPLIIDYIYMIGDRLQKSNTNFSASDLLSFYGSILSFLGTVALGILALYLNKKANDINAELLKQANESEKKSVLPYLTFNKYFTKYEGDILISVFDKMKEVDRDNKSFISKDTVRRIDNLFDELNFTITKDRISLSKELNQRQKDKIKNPYGIVATKNSGSVRVPDYSYAKVFVENCGKGTAINTVCRLYSIGGEDNVDLDVTSIPFTIPIFEKFDIGIYVDLQTDFEGKYMMEFVYNDIYMNCYKQCIPVEIKNKDIILDISSPQKDCILDKEEIDYEDNNFRR